MLYSVLKLLVQINKLLRKLNIYQLEQTQYHYQLIKN